MYPCNNCGKDSSIFVYSHKLKMVVCKPCGKGMGEVTEGKRGVYDANGNLRDREWLNKKLEMTRTEKKWHDDIRSRKALPDGSVIRNKK